LVISVSDGSDNLGLNFLSTNTNHYHYSLQKELGYGTHRRS
jgi:hypothetical protein